LGNNCGSIVHVTFLEYGPAITKRFFSDYQFIINNWLATFGFSIGIGDCVCDEETLQEIKKEINSAKRKVKQLILDCQMGTLKGRQPGKSLLDCFEAQVNNELANVRNTAGNLAQKALYDNNNISLMVTAGSKGSNLNISQISACVGQQNVVGQRIAPNFNKRTVPHFCKDDLGPESRGFASNS